MTEKLFFQETQMTSQALGQFAEARLGPKLDKDVILIVKKIDGREQLEITRLSEMPWLARIVRWFGFGGATLSSVANFLQSHEPYLPERFSLLQNRSLMTLFYAEEDMDAVMNLNKGTYRELKKQKVRGCEIFKRCVAHHNQRHMWKVYVLLQEHGKVDLRSHGSSTSYGIAHSTPNPIGNSADKVRERYTAPHLDLNLKEFDHLDPFFKDRTDTVPKKVLGFSYEYGLGIRQDLDQALMHYRLAVAQNEYSACYNLGRLLLQRDEAQEAVDVLKQGETILTFKIDQAQKTIDDAKTKHPTVAFTDVLEKTGSLYIQEWSKVLNKTYALLSQAYQALGDQKSADEYAAKI